MKRKILVLIGAIFMALNFAVAQNARLQIIHNSADLAAESVDVFVNGGIFLEDFKFRTATPFVDVPGGVDLIIDIAPAGAGIENSVGTFGANFVPGETYIAIASGIVSDAGYDPIYFFDLYPYFNARETANSAVNTDVLVFHGSTDAPEVSVWETGVGAGELFTFSYPNYEGYLELPTADYILEIRAGGEPVAAYYAPLATAGLFGQAITVVASGFLNPANNSDGPAFGLFVALATGGDLIELPAVESARVQIIHNSADLAADSVDIFVDGVLFLEDFAFRTATPFVDVPAGVDLQIDIAPSGAGIENSVGSFNANFMNKETYVIVANGIVSADGYEPKIDFDLYPFTGAREMADTTMFADSIKNTDVLVFHGSTDAPEVSVWEIGVGAGELFTFGYGEYAGYLELPTEDYVLEIRAGGNPVVAYSAPLKTLNLDGQALTVVASGFLNPANNSDGAAFGLFVALSAGGELIELPVYEEKTARIQIIHNSADLAAQSVDVFVNGDILLPGFKFRTASPFVTVPAEVELSIDIAPAGAGIENSVGTFDFTLAADETYIAIANGIVSADGYEPSIAFDVYPYAGAREAAMDSSKTDVLVFHGSTDAPEVSVWEIGAGAGELFTFAYGEYAGYLELPNEDYVLEIRAGGQAVVAYSAPLKSFSLDGEAITVVASGFLNPANNSDGPGFGLFVALSTGGDLIELPVFEEEKTARLQVIHNSADLAAQSVDVFVNGDILLPGFKFRTATPFVTVPAEVELSIDIAPAGAGIENSVGTFDFTLAADEKYVAIANGIVSADGYEPSIAFDIYPYAGAREAAMDSSKTDVLVFHGSTDAPEVTVWETGVGAGELFTFAYGEYAGYLELPNEDYVLEIRAGGQAVVAYSAPLKSFSLDGEAITVVASGFLNPANNSDGSGFGLFVALSTGGELIELPVYQEEKTARVQVIHNSADAAAAVVDVWLNETKLIENFAFRTSTPFIDAPAGVLLNIGIAPPNSTSWTQSLSIKQVVLTENQTYVVIANGIVSTSGYTPSPAFDLVVYPIGREAASQAGNTDILVFHGSTDAPEVSVWETGVGVGELFTFGYGQFAGYLEVPTNDYVLEIRAGGETVVAYKAPLASFNLDGVAITVVASGFLNPANNSDGPGFGLFVALPSGGQLIALETFTSSISNIVLDYKLIVYPNPVTEKLFIEADIEKQADISISIYNTLGNKIADIYNERNVIGTRSVNYDISSLNTGVYFVTIANGEGIQARKIQVIK